MSVPITANPELDEQRRRGLRRMRSLAVGLLLLAAVVYVLTRDQTGWLGFVNAGAEASMVGAIADWFAVTALFRHPLGLPIPHTALIPRRKEELGRSLEEFVGENFLHESIVRERIDAAGLSRRVGAWLSTEDNARRVVDEAAAVLHLALERIRDDDMVVAGRGGAAAAVPRRADQPDRRQPARGGGPRRRAPRPGRPGARRGAPLADPERGDLRRDRSASGRPGGRPPRSTTGSPTGCTSRRSTGSRTSATTRTTTPAAPSTARSTQLADDLLHDPRDPGADGAAQGPGAVPPAAGGHRDVAVERLPAGADGVPRRPGGAAAAPRATPS